VRDPRRSALGLLAASGGDGLPAGLGAAFEAGELGVLQAMLARDLNCPRTSSLGRLFDAVAALAGVRARPGFEGQGAMALEFAAERAAPDRVYGWAFTGVETLVADPAPLVAELLRDRRVGAPPEALARRFHAALADLALAWARHAGLRDVVLAGGCFQNALLTALVMARLSEAGFRVHRHRRFPPNDGSIALGQAAVAAARSC
jgi:hydrogenase maturation protein HypF